MQILASSNRILKLGMLCALAACGAQTEGQNGLARSGVADSGHPTAQGARQMDYDPIPLARLIGTTDLAVIGEVIAVEDGFVTIGVGEVLLGDAGSELRMAEFVPSKFDPPRAAPYARGQRFVLFLTRESGAAESWRVRGLGGEGEMPVEDGYVYFHGRVVQGLPKGTYRVHGAERDIQRFDLDAFGDAVRGYTACFAWKQDERRRWEASVECEASELRSYRDRSRIHEIIAAESLKSAG